MKNHKTTVLLIGGYGFFGGRLAKLLSPDAELRVVIAGRNRSQADKLIDALSLAGARCEFESAQIDSTSATLSSQVAATGATIVVNLNGPFQRQDYRVAHACIEAGAHYLDLADARDFVLGIGALDAQAKAAGLLVTSGASSVPAFSSAVLDTLAPAFSEMTDIDIGITPGNRTDRGPATVAAILSYCGEPIRIWNNARWECAAGWFKHVRHAYPAPVGSRWLALCDVPDLTLHADRYPAVRSVVFRGGLELPVLHLGLAAVSALRRVRLLPNLTAFASFAKWASEAVIRLGTDAGAMHVDVVGKGLSGEPLGKRWTLVAKDGDGPYVPALAAAALVRKLKNGDLHEAGATPCVGLLTLKDFEAQFGDLAIYTTEETL
ncbi:saccharopine dehydrogenase family protein [Paraburkholderia sp.]|uniref:saccharopine dehydrogenase family protein n=1 Tax=Paraburkholderia sp. TaxID=1926495 RepID=UPI003D6F32D9